MKRKGGEGTEDGGKGRGEDWEMRGEERGEGKGREREGKEHLPRLRLSSGYAPANALLELRLLLLSAIADRAMETEGLLLVFTIPSKVGVW